MLPFSHLLSCCAFHQKVIRATMEENHSPFPMHFYGLCCKNLKLIKIMHRLAVKEAFTWKRGAFFACFTLIQFSSMHHFDELKIFATLRVDNTVSDKGGY